MLSVLRDDEKRKKKREAEKKTDEKWRVENGIQFRTSVGGVLEIGNCAVFFFAAGHRDNLPGNFMRGDLFLASSCCFGSKMAVFIR